MGRTASEQEVAVVAFTVDDNRTPTAPDALPTAKLFRNGADSGVVVTITALAGTGEYSAAWTNGAWSAGDQLALALYYAIGAVNRTAVVWTGHVDIVPVNITTALKIPFVPVEGEFLVVEGDDHKQENSRGAIGPIGPVTTDTDLDAANVSLRAGFTQKIGTRYAGETFEGTAYAVATGNPNEWNLYIELEGTETAGKTPGVFGFDIEALEDLTGGNVDVITITQGESTLIKSFGAHP